MMSSLLIAWTLTGCSKAVVIPRDQLGGEQYRKPGSYRIKLHGWNEYNARRFSTTDSTVLIEELVVSDDHYKLKRDDMPIVVPLKDVEYIGVMRTNWWATTGFVVFAGALVGFFVWLGQGDSWSN